MNPAPDTAARPAAAPARARRFRSDTLAYALVAQAVVLLVAVFMVVIRPLLRTEPQFTGGAPVHLPQRELEHRAAVAEWEQSAGVAPPLERLATAALLPPELPALPKVPRMEGAATEPVDYLARDAQALLAQSGLHGAVGGLRSVASAAAFFGVEASGERIVIVVNTSVSVRNKAQRRGVPWSRIQEEVTRVIDGLDGATLFSVVQFSQGVRVFPESLAPATAGNRDAMRAWVREELRGNPPVDATAARFGHEAAFDAALALDPDVVFLVTDGVLDRREVRGGRVVYPEIPYGVLLDSVREARRGSRRRIQVHVIGFEMRPGDAGGMRALADEFGGQLRQF
ncbi:MAG: hypothetical protein IAE82_16895 [Opitutaceae bacterium]|nr:hypothetical protein [Opitutaceae bacterium]